MPRRRQRPLTVPGDYIKRYGNLTTASRALAVAYAVKKLINVEYFSKRTSFTVDPNTTGAVVALTNIAQGSDKDERQGNKLRVKRLSLGGVITLHASATDSRVRMTIIRDNNGSTTQPAITDLFGTVADHFNNSIKTGDPQSNSRFSVLWDKMLIVNSDTPTKQLKYAMELDHHVFYTGTASTDEGKGHMYLFISSSEATNDPVVAIKAQVWYIDN